MAYLFNMGLQRKNKVGINQDTAPRVTCRAVPRLQSVCRVNQEVSCDASIKACIDDVCDDVQSLASWSHYVTDSGSGSQFGQESKYMGQQNAIKVSHTLWFLQILIATVC